MDKRMDKSIDILKTNDVYYLEESNQYIEYDPDSNTIFNSNNEVINLEQKFESSFYEEEAKLHGVNTKSDTPTALRIVLGHACNYSCSYCMQKDIGDPTEKPVNFNLDNFKKTITQKLKFDKLKRVELWGGEPFLYWNDVKELITFFDNENMSFFISTNGSPLRQKHVDFFASVKSTILISISHDGPGQKELRGDDILESELTNSIIKKLLSVSNVQLGFGAVISRTNHDLYKIHDYFKSYADSQNIKDLKLTLIQALNYDSTNSQNSANHVIDDLSSFSNIMESFIADAIDKPQEFLRISILEDVIGAYGVSDFLKNRAPKIYSSGCGADSADILSLDMFGNVRLCPHTDISFIAGRLDDLENVKIKQLALTRKSTHCSNCPVRRLCKSSCPIDLPKDVFLSNCRFEKIWWQNILNSSLSLLFGEKVRPKK